MIHFGCCLAFVGNIVRRYLARDRVSSYRFYRVLVWGTVMVLVTTVGVRVPIGLDGGLARAEPHRHCPDRRPSWHRRGCRAASAFAISAGVIDTFATRVTRAIAVTHCGPVSPGRTSKAHRLRL
jgi:hypothetical protein